MKIVHELKKHKSENDLLNFYSMNKLDRHFFIIILVFCIQVSFKYQVIIQTVTYTQGPTHMCEGPWFNQSFLVWQEIIHFLNHLPSFRSHYFPYTIEHKLLVLNVYMSILLCSNIRFLVMMARKWNGYFLSLYLLTLFFLFPFIATKKV